MKISARNILRGQVETLKAGAVNSEVDIVLPGGEKLVAMITNDSAQSLGLEAGKEVIALVKASSVMVMTDTSGIRLSARNCLSGTVKKVTSGPVNAEVTIALDGGAEVHATVTHAAETELGITEGIAATAVFKASAVILGVTA